MFNKVTTIAILILVFLMIGLLIITLSNRAEVNDQPNPISFSTEDSVDIAFTPDKENPKYVYIEDDRIYINYSDESYMPVKLEEKSWTNVLLSPNRNFVAVLGMENANVNDLYLYDIEQKEFNKVTFFENEPTGITSFYWVNDNLITFHQDQWLHSLNVSSKEIVKVQSGIANLKGLVDGKALVNNANNKGATFDFEAGDFQDNVFASTVNSISETDDETFISLSDGIFVLNGEEAEKVSEISGGQVCGDVVLANFIVSTILDNERININEVPEYACVQNSLYYKDNSKWYTLDNEEIPELESSTSFDIF